LTEFKLLVQNFWSKKSIFAPKKFKHPLISLALSQAFQADDEGSIPFTRSNDFKGLDVVFVRGAKLVAV
jgi:hypothetical protein